MPAQQTGELNQIYKCHRAVPFLSSALALNPSPDAPSGWLILGTMIGFPLALWAYKCIMMVLLQRKFIYMSYLPPTARTEELGQFATPSKEISCEEVRIEGEGSIVLYGLLIRKRSISPQLVKSVVVYFQGNAGNPITRLPIFERLLLGPRLFSMHDSEMPEDTVILAVAPRSYWKSSSARPSEAGFISDYTKAITYAMTCFPEASIILYGHSLGGTVAVCLSAQLKAREFPNVKGLILENPFTSIPAMVEVLYPQTWLPYHYLSPLAFDKWDALSAMQQPPADSLLSALAGVVMVVLSEKDEIVPKSMGTSIFNSSVLAKPMTENESEGRKLRRLVVIDRALHEDAWERRKWRMAMGEYISSVRPVSRNVFLHKMSKQKARANPTQLSGLYKAESVRDVAESLNISGLSDTVASALASDVEYRIHQVVESHYTVTSHITHRPSDALPPYPHMQGAGTVYFVEDEEIDFDRVIREDKIALPKGPRWTAHWLAVEGVQPLIPENPPAIPKEQEGDGVSKPGTSRQNGYMTPASDRASPLQNGKPQQGHQAHGKTTLSRELQLYLTRLTSSLLPPSQTEPARRTAALSSLATDAGLQPLLPNLVSWVTRNIVRALQGGERSEDAGAELNILLDTIEKILKNPSLFVEPYLHQILPAILSTLLHSELLPAWSTTLRTKAAQVMSQLLTQHSTTYPSLSPRIMKTLLLALISSDKKKSTREGAIRGLMGIGKEAIRKGLVESGGAKIVGSECTFGDQGTLVSAVMAAFEVLSPRPQYTMPLNPNDPSDAEILHQLRDTLGEFFAERLAVDGRWARGVLFGDQDG
ncbi:hypothetical protein NM688_g6413 [Phlebia brevispora]|uniref:Uncharacterized protein n=1 Tax=Phlebia brevispora TaxID=194682 RepID=A0ACC1SG78_9APHY|nr:hypothetical protein NM688_g6413 [Phlebia brevispora]